MPPSQVISYCEGLKDSDILHLDIEDVFKRVDVAAMSNMLYIK